MSCEEGSMDHRSAREQRIWEGWSRAAKAATPRPIPSLRTWQFGWRMIRNFASICSMCQRPTKQSMRPLPTCPFRPAWPIESHVAWRKPDRRPPQPQQPQGPVAPPAPSDSFAVLATTTPDAPAPPPRRPGPFSRRRLAVGFAAISAAVALLAAVWIQTHRPRQETPASVLEEAMDFFGKDNATLGKPVAEEAPPAEYPMSRDLVSLPGVRWR